MKITYIFYFIFLIFIAVSCIDSDERYDYKKPQYDVPAGDTGNEDTEDEFFNNGENILLPETEYDIVQEITIEPEDTIVENDGQKFEEQISEEENELQKDIARPSIDAGNAEEENIVQENEIKYIALTFDDGPEKNITPMLLDILKENGAKATFFVMGYNAEKNTEIIKRMVEEGHVVGNHTFSHTKLTLLTDEKINEEIDKTNAIIKDATALDTTLIRPSYGARDENIVRIISDKKMSVVVWNLDPRDWEIRNSEKISKDIISKSKAGDIILLHDLYQSSVEAAEIVIKDLSEKGFVFVTVPELIEKYGEIEVGGIYRSGRETVKE